MDWIKLQRLIARENIKRERDMKNTYKLLCAAWIGLTAMVLGANPSLAAEYLSPGVFIEEPSSIRSTTVESRKEKKRLSGQSRATKPIPGINSSRKELKPNSIIENRAIYLKHESIKGNVTTTENSSHRKSKQNKKGNRAKISSGN